jgi:hypothetical protein
VLGYTNEQPPDYGDKFWEVRQMIGAWNKNIKEQFSASWVNCLDESMSIWYIRYTYPGWMFVPRKPHHFGNEYHSICCALSGIMFGIELVEGKSSPPERPRDINETQGKTVALLLRLCKPLYTTGKVVILDSGFFFCKSSNLVENQRSVCGGGDKKEKVLAPLHQRGCDQCSYGG